MPNLIAVPTLICPTCCCTEATATLKCMPEKKEEDEEKLFHYFSFDSGWLSIHQKKHCMKCGIVMISSDLRVLHRPQSFIYILDGSDKSWVMRLLPSGFWGETQFPTFSPSAQKHCSAHQAQVNLPFLQGMMSKSKSGWYLSTNNWVQFQ